jgi:glycosyltransferase involved in cell wall biosynthesis
MPAKGECIGLDQSAASILGQTLQVEWIIIKPKNHEVTSGALSLLPSDPRIRIIDEESIGIFAAMNQGLREARGNYVVFFGVGDYWIASNAAYHMTTKLVKENKQWGFGSWYFLKEDNSLISPPTDVKIFEHQVFHTTTPLCHQTVVASKKVLERTGGFDTKIIVAADRLSIRKLWEDSEPAIWEFPTIAYKTGGFSAVNQAQGVKELELLELQWKNSKNFISQIRRHIRSLSGQFLKKKKRDVFSTAQFDQMTLFDWVPDAIKLSS